ncbi:MAG: 3-isopropylmalate dehydratase small subunit [Acidimicrobiaceae bacterium]|jgi:3-isopropylmalate/(R)-2-methylmalate dehydratase small subunit|nr:3-isopropylmalate dehydratase small subunit [Acidimicrobiaceae bacterium]|tara:strand:- start:67337 stop:67927 length:591 start_codon:yes stop_codon:yes gene_type:complete
MKPVVVIEGTAVPLDRSDVDTDQIIPSDWLKRVERTGFEKGLFSEWRDNKDFVLNNADYSGANILLAGPNFGTGSSREHAVWAIQQAGFDAVISPRFGPIFKNNSTKNGLVPVEIESSVAEELMQQVQRDPNLYFVIDIAKRSLEVTQLGITIDFPLESSIQDRFLKGLDDIAITLEHTNAIETFEKHRNSWLQRQ